MKFRPMEAELYHAGGRKADMTKLIVAVRDFVNAPKHELYKTKDISFSKYSSS
jgi:hypothetical protein